MKIFRDVLALIGLFFVLIFISCKDGQGTKSNADFHLVNADSILSQYNAVRENWDWSYRVEGDVNITVKDSMISMEFVSGGGDQFITYFLQTSGKERRLKTGPFGKSEVLFLDRNLIINSLEREKTLFFSIGVDPEPGYLKSMHRVDHYKGIGLGVRMVNKTGANQNVPYCSCEPVGSPEDLCSSGGSGSLSCSTSNSEGSCRVSCSGQTFACCESKSE